MSLSVANCRRPELYPLDLLNFFRFVVLPNHLPINWGTFHRVFPKLTPTLAFDAHAYGRTRRRPRSGKGWCLSIGLYQRRQVVFPELESRWRDAGAPGARLADLHRWKGLIAIACHGADNRLQQRVTDSTTWRLRERERWARISTKRLPGIRRRKSDDLHGSTAAACFAGAEVPLLV